MNPNLFLSPYFVHNVGAQLVMIHVNSTKHYYMLYIMMFEINMLNKTTWNNINTIPQAVFLELNNISNLKI